MPLIELSWTKQLYDYIWWVSPHFWDTANILLLCLSFREHPLFAILFCQFIWPVQGVHVHDDHYLLNSVEVSLKTARSRIVHTSIDHGRDEQRPIKENTKKFVGTCFIELDSYK